MSSPLRKGWTGLSDEWKFLLLLILLLAVVWLDSARGAANRDDPSLIRVPDRSSSLLREQSDGGLHFHH